MASGQQRSEENLANFPSWMASKRVDAMAPESVAKG
jgi:hypothetical protein